MRDILNSIKFFSNSKKVILSVVPYDFVPGKFGGGDKIRSIYKSLSRDYNVNVVVPIAYGNKFQFEKLYDDVHIYKVPLSEEYYKDDQTFYYEVIKSYTFDDVLMAEKFDKLKELKNFIKILSLHSDYIFCEHGQAFPFIDYYEKVFPIVVNHYNYELDLKRNYFKDCIDKKEAQFILKILEKNEKKSVHAADFNTFVSMNDLKNFVNNHKYYSNNFKIISNFFIL
jgi:hypothetical protein